MTDHTQGLSPKQCFDLFKNNPKTQTIDVLQVTHKFLMDSLENKLEDPTVDTLIEIFQIFSGDSIKRYVFKSIKKNLNLEIALSIVQELISNGPARAQTLNLKVVRLGHKGKKIVVRDDFQSPGEIPLSSDDFPHIDEVIVRFSDKSGKSSAKSTQSVAKSSKR